jgi:hypothetical protein
MVIFQVRLSYVEESARENIEHDKPCESYESLKWTSLFSKEGKYLLATLYSQGICFAQDIPQAKNLYGSAFGDDQKKIAQALFHDAIQLADFYERNHKDKGSENIRSLLRESKKLGFLPSDRDLKDLEERKLTVDF